MIGFPAMGEYTMMLEDAVFKPTGNSQVVAATSISAQDAMKGDYDGKLVQMQGRLVSKDLTSEDPRLLMSSGGLFYFAVLPRGTEAEQIASWPVGSKVQLTGICSVQVDKYLSTRCV